MGETDRGPAALRVERGTATEEELAALAVVLLALRTRPEQKDARTRPAAGALWWRQGRHRAPQGWQAGTGR
jgi:hypothetical protein